MMRERERPMRERDQNGFREPAERKREERGSARERVSEQLIGERDFLWQLGVVFCA
jgi:hypothetical protein